MYRYENEQLFKIQFAIYAVEALTTRNPDNHLLLYADQKHHDKLKGFEVSPPSQKPQQPSLKDTTSGSSSRFVSTLYIGYYKNNLYALPSFVYSWQALSLVEDVEPPPSPPPSPPPLIGTGDQDNNQFVMLFF